MSATDYDSSLATLARWDDDAEHATVRKCANVPTWQPDAFMTRAAAEAVLTRGLAGVGAVFVVDGGTPSAADCRRWVAAGWDVRSAGRYPIVKREGTTLRWFHSWAGRDVTPDEAAATWAAIGAGCHRFGAAGPLTSPAVTGLDLWQRTIGEGVSYPCPPAQLAGFLRDTASQGRVELLPPLVSLIPGVYEYDSRLAYLGCLHELPAGRPEVIDYTASAWRARPSAPAPYDETGIGPYVPARLLAIWTAPDGWHRAGVFREGRRFPLASSGPTWVDNAEVRLARRFGWDVRVLAALVWPHRVSPFRGWLERLRAVMATEPAGVPPDVWRNVWRSIALQTIGSLHGSPLVYRHFAATGSASKQPRQPRANLAHPEWTSAIWTRARLRLLDAPGGGGEPRVGAWHLPAPTVLGFRTDALYTTQPTGWADDGRIGRYRLKRQGGPRSWPLIEPQLLAGLEPVVIRK